MKLASAPVSFIIITPVLEADDTNNPRKTNVPAKEATTTPNVRNAATFRRAISTGETPDWPRLFARNEWGREKNRDDSIN